MNDVVASQVIAVANDTMQIVFSDVIGQITRMFHQYLIPKIMLNEGLPDRYLSGHINRYTMNRKVQFMEGDISKFDKSQNEFTLCLEVALMRRFNIPDELI